MKIQIVRGPEDKVTESAYSADTPLEEVMDDVYYDTPRRHGRDLVTEVRRVDSFGRVHERLTASQYAARKESRE